MILLITFLIFQSNNLKDLPDQQSVTYFYESFDNMNQWEELQFDSDKKTTEFSIIDTEFGQSLQIKSDTSSSALICRKRFNPNDYSMLQWKWKVNNIIPNTDGKTRKGDDYAIRIFVMFEKDSEKLTIWEKIERGAIKLISGYNIPYKSICYVWANTVSDTVNYLSPYSEDVMIICRQMGSAKLNQWIKEEVNVTEDFQKYFNKDVPAVAGIAISGDTDNTLFSTQSFLDFIVIK